MPETDAKPDGLHYSMNRRRWEVWQDGEIVYMRNVLEGENFLEVFNQTLNVGVKAYGLKLELVVGVQKTTF